MGKIKTGYLLLNVGTPSSPSVKDVRAYLREFLTDRRMISLPAWLRYPLVYGLIAPLRGRGSAKKYQAIWCKEKGSPLSYNSVLCREKLQSFLGEGTPVALGMRYGTPSIKQAIDALIDKNCTEIIVFPMFPQYASATTASSIEAVFNILNQKNNMPGVVTITHFYDSHYYINALKSQLRPIIEERKPEKIVFSYHGLPLKQIEQSEKVTPKDCYTNKPCPAICGANRECYRAQCFETSRLIGEALGVSMDSICTVFQSRLGPLPWIGPDFNSKLHELAGQGVKNILVACPSFTADCLETLEEVGLEGQSTWKALGGEQYHLVPCLNDNQDWIEAIPLIAASRNRYIQN